MKRVLFLGAMVLSTAVMAQNEAVAGQYTTEPNPSGLEIRMKPDGTFEFVAFSGTYTVKDQRISLQPKSVNAFQVKRKEGSSAVLQLTFKGGEDLDPRYIYLGYENAKGGIDYVCLYNKITNIDERKPVDSGNPYPLYALETVEIPKTENLYLVDASRVQAMGKGAEVHIEKIPVGKTTSAVEVLYTGVLRSGLGKMEGVYKADKQELVLKPERGADIVIKKIGAQKDNEVLTHSSAEEVKGWKHLIAFDEENDIPDYNPEKKKASQAVVKAARSLNEAIAQAKKNDRLVMVFYQPQNKEAEKVFEELLKSYQEILSAYDQSAGREQAITPKDLISYEFYLTGKKDAKWVKANKLSDTDQYVVLDGQGAIVYKEETTINTLEAGDLISDNTRYRVFHTAAKAKEIDQVLTNAKAPLKAVEKAFTTITGDEDYLPFLLVKEEKKEGEETPDGSYEREGYFQNLKNTDRLYTVKLTPEQLTAQWTRLIEAHKGDKKLDVDYARVLVNNFGENNYYKQYFLKEKEPQTADLGAIVYLVNFYKDIEAHNKVLLKKEGVDLETAYQDGEDYYPLSIRNKKDFIPLRKQSIQTLLLFANFVDKPEQQAVLNKALHKALEVGVLSLGDYIDLAYERQPQEAIQLFRDYYKGLLKKDGNLISGLDAAFSTETTDADDSWKYYKMKFANRANNVAWKVYETERNNPELLKEALAWSQVAVQMEKRAPYLDTLAHLLFVSGEKKKALEIQEEAVKLLETSKDEDERAMLKELRENLNKMRSEK